MQKMLATHRLNLMNLLTLKILEPEKYKHEGEHLEYGHVSNLMGGEQKQESEILKTLTGSGHYPHFEEPAKFLQNIQFFLN